MLSALPFWIRRPALIARDLIASRERPDLRALARIEDAERFVWAILPHAARTFSACIALMPRRTALPSAVAYLYCRMLDTYEDLVPDNAVRQRSLRDFSARLAAEGPDIPAAPTITSANVNDDRDKAHVLLVERAALVDRVFATFDAETREIIRDLVRDMAEGMCWSSETFASQGGLLRNEAQLSTYCRHVLGNPTVFGIRILRLHYGQPTRLTDEERENAMVVGEFVQLANVTRDIEKDLRRGIAYDASLSHDLHSSAVSEAALSRIRTARERMLRMALRRAPSYARVIDSIRLPKVSIARAAAVLMLLFTERYYRHCAERVGLKSWPGPESTVTLLARALATVLSPAKGSREMARVEREMIAAA